MDQEISEPSRGRPASPLPSPKNDAIYLWQYTEEVVGNLTKGL